MGKKFESGIRDKHPGSATLRWIVNFVNNEVFSLNVVRDRDCGSKKGLIDE
jgi:hypothetical protein